VPVRRLQFVPAPLEAMTGHLAGVVIPLAIGGDARLPEDLA